MPYIYSITIFNFKIDSWFFRLNSMTKRDQYGRYEWDEEVFAQKHEERLKKEKR